MNKLYVFSKIAVDGKYYRSLYGEVQSDFNINYVLDGTKDNAKVEVYNYDKEAIKPYTIVFIECGASADLSYFIVSKDKVERFETEEKASGYYKHPIDLLGCFELLNARDLTNCGFNIDRYTYEQFCLRLANMSDFELPITFDLSPYIDKDQVVKYLKTFQNYSPMSAIRELFDGVNCIAKMYFETATDSNGVYLTNAVIKAYSKSGNNKQIVDISEFDDSNENTNIDKESYGTRVVSNAENVVSADKVRYPAIGGAKATGSTPNISLESAYLRLPSNIYKVDTFTIFKNVRFIISGVISRYNSSPSFLTKSELKNYLISLVDTNSYEYSLSDSDFDLIFEYIQNNFIYKFNNGGKYYSVDGSWTGDYKEFQTSGLARTICLNDETHKNTNEISHGVITSTIYWKQSDNKIHLTTLYDTRCPTSATSGSFYGPFHFARYLNGGVDLTIKVDDPLNTLITPYDYFACEYVPMGDLKIKVENENEQNDSNFYNQNGKLVDSGSVSKLINSHAIEISSDEKIRYKHFFKFSDIYQIGQKVKDNNDIYVINNVSIDLIDNDDFGYFYACQFAMTKATACKSTMISANTNIRDYQCPQQNNVKRVQLYRDYLEFGYSALEHTETPYLALNQVFNFTSSNYGLNDNHYCLIKVQDDDFINISDNPDNNNPNGYYYYKLETTKYNLNKQFIEVCDFLDNNIIGYEAFTPYYVLTPSNLLFWKGQVANTPISYVDDYGELDCVELLFVDETQCYDAFNNPADDFNGNGNGATTEIMSKFVSITQNTYDYAYNNGYDIKITEDNYKKDGLEVPVFEYSCQVGDSNGIYFGQDFLKGIKITGVNTETTTNTGSYSYTIASDTINANSYKEYSVVVADTIGLTLDSSGVSDDISQLNITTTIISFDNTTGTFVVRITNNGNTPLILYDNFLLIEYTYSTTAYTDGYFVYKYRVIDKKEIINQENATLYTSESDNNCTYSYDDVNKKLTITLASSENLKGKDIVFFAYRYENDTIYKVFMFAINDYQLNGATSTIELFVNNWKLR